MATWYVEPTAPAGTVGGNTWASAGDLDATLTAVLATPSPGGDEIWAKQGTYNLANPLVINQNTQPLSIYGSCDGTESSLCDRKANIISNPPPLIPPATIPDFFPNPSILDGGGGNRVIEIQNATACLIDGFLITQGNSGTMDGGGVHAHDSNILRFENMVFMDNTSSNRGGGLFIVGTRNVMVKNTVFFDNHVANIGTGGGGFCIESCFNVKLTNSLFNANTGDGAAMYILDSFDVLLTNNTISGNIAPAGREVCIDSPTVDVFNSIFYPDNLMIIGGNVTIDYCLLNQNNLPFNPNNIIPPNNNPNFVNQASLSAGGDYHLSNTATSQSPCIDWGNTNKIFPLSATDLEGKPRFIDKGINPSPLFSPGREVDMGALETQ
jgi:hypothetical protein